MTDIGLKTLLYVLSLYVLPSCIVIDTNYNTTWNLLSVAGHKILRMHFLLITAFIVNHSLMHFGAARA